MNWLSGNVYAPLIVAAVAAGFVALAGGLLTEIGPWYRGLKKPGWQPPDWLFGPAWTLIFTLCALSAAQGWWGLSERDSGAALIGAFAVNAVLNMLWSGLFFYARRPDWALYELAALWVSIVVLIVVVSHSSTIGALLLLPYLAWVTFAGVLNATVVRLNAPFPGRPS